MNGRQFEQSSFTVGGGGSRAYDEGYERTFGKKRPDAPAPSDAEAVQPDPRGFAGLAGCNGCGDAHQTDGALSLRAKLEALAEQWIKASKLVPLRSSLGVAEELRAVLRGDK